MALSRTQNLADHKVPMRRYKLTAPVKRGKTEESEASRSAGTDTRDPAKAPDKRPDRTTDRNPPQRGSNGAAGRRIGDEPQRAGGEVKGGENVRAPRPGSAEYGDMSRGSLRKGGQKGTPEQAKRLAQAMRGGARHEP